MFNRKPKIQKLYITTYINRTAQFTLPGYEFISCEAKSSKRVEGLAIENGVEIHVTKHENGKYAGANVQAVVYLRRK